MDTTFDSDVRKLPPETRGLFFSEFQRILSNEIGEQYKLSLKQISVFDSLADDLYLDRETVKDLPNLLMEDLGIDMVTAQSLACDIVGKKLLAADSYFKSRGEDLAGYLREWGSDVSKYQKDAETLKKAAAEEAAGTFDYDQYLYRNEPDPVESPVSDDDEEADEEDMSPEDRLESLKNFLSNNLLLALQPDSGDTIDDINLSLIETLADNEISKKAIEEVIANNDALIGSQPIISEGREVTQTAGAWLKDFYKVVGTGSFDALTAARYLIESPNAKRLAEADKQLLRRYLLFYHNVKQFPTPFLSFPVEQWHVIPEIPAVEPTVDLPSSAIPPVSKPVEPVNPIPEPAAPQLQPKEESEELMNLKNLLLQYPADSLERKAIEEEIRKMSN